MNTAIKLITGKTYFILFLLLPLYTFSQPISLGVSKDLGWAVWTYDTLDFRDDCTILKGYFVPAANGCWVTSKMNETLETCGREYRIIYTTLPLNRHPRTTYKGGIKVFFEAHFEPIFSTDGVIRFTSHDINFTIPFKRRKISKPLESLFADYKNHIDTLISQGKYGIAAYLLNQYIRNVWHQCPLKARKRISQTILSKYRVHDFYLNSSTEDRDILSLFEDTYQRLNYLGNDDIFERLTEIDRLQMDINFNMNGNLSKVLAWCDTLTTNIKVFGKYNKCYEYALSNYRKALVMDGQKEKVQKLDNEIIDVCSHIYNKNGAQYLERLMDIASNVDIHPSKIPYETSWGILLWKEVRDRAKLNFPNSWKYANSLMEIARYNVRNQYFDIALMQFLTIDSLYREKRKEWIYEVWYNHDYLSNKQSEIFVDLSHESLSKSIGYCYYQIGDVANAIKFDSKNPYYHWELGNYDVLSFLCKELYEESVKGLKGIIKKPTIISPGAYYEEGFDMAYAPALTTHIPYFAYMTNSIDLCEKAYNGTLITKEFRLTAGNKLKKYLRSTQDSTSIDYKKRIEKEIDNYQSMTKAHELGAIDKQWEIIQLQRELISHLDSIHALDTFFPDWKDVCNSLERDEIAIEFIDIPLWNKSQSVYAALTLRKDSDYPKMTFLFEKNQLEQVSDTLYYQCSDMTNLVWKPLQSELQGIRNIYFSPSGALYNIGIEYLPGMEDYQIYRLSSTRELVTNQRSESENHAVLYGGLDYNAALGPSGIDEPSPSEDGAVIEHINLRGVKFRGGQALLPQTKIEVEQIGEEFGKARWEYQLFTDSTGTEESFKALSGKRLRSLHLATHGFYYTPEEADNLRYEFMNMNHSVVSAEDKALTRSGLILSGANHILERETLPDNVEDGILTAKEIAGLDLRGLDLVVLSACQTGLGDISQSEGVFGLQRGFKKAGANSILMSLWEVNDKATRILMTQFYRHLLSGQDKRQSLLSAQKYLREIEHGKYDEPKYWAAFILLDGIN